MSAFIFRLVSQPRLLIIISSTRPGRIGLPVANWFVEQAGAHGGFEVELADLYELDLPLLDEPNHPRLRQYIRPHTRAWSETVEGADAVVFVTAEYNHSFTAALKNAIDYLHHEWRHKPLGFVSYGGVAAGTRAMQALKPVAIALALVPVVAAVNIPFVQQFLSDDGAIVGNDVMVDAASAMLDELMTMHGALAPLRAARA
jgi:NAD(P)H-dependent FMN reductase